ncbi:CPBP family intramembrane glutamic endopeptidase [uncultured Acetobacteroides sp.]|uniref:CPBP family intramembrane glutamic endopeptidase n=1 Tax=uncultured Acetobacteroides sp. TaxID=1760811 RepID=UPI0029F4AD7C|nr:CPBP family intramembrane glutamic endopeptidase [uncultured Acetobacteroides sp.]
MNRTIVLLAFYILISLGISMALGMFGFIFEFTGFPKNQISDITTTLGIAIASAITIYYGYRKGYMRRSDFSYNLSGIQASYTFILFLLLFILIGIFDEYVSLPDLFNWMNIDFRSPSTIIAMVIVAPIAEEIIFRGMITKLLLEEYRPIKAILISALIFGIIHFNPAQIPVAFVLGLLFGWLYYKTGSIIPGIILHFTNNAVVILGAVYLGEEWKFNNNTLALSLLAISLIALPFILKRAQLAFAKKEEWL